MNKRFRKSRKDLNNQTRKLGATGLREQPTFDDLVKQLEENPRYGSKSIKAPHRAALNMMRDPRIQQIVGALPETAQAFEENFQDHMAKRAMISGIASEYGLPASVLHSLGEANSARYMADVITTVQGMSKEQIEAAMAHPEISTSSMVMSVLKKYASAAAVAAGSHVSQAVANNNASILKAAQTLLNPSNWMTGGGAQASSSSSGPVAVVDPKIALQLNDLKAKQDQLQQQAMDQNKMLMQVALNIEGMMRQQEIGQAVRDRLQEEQRSVLLNVRKMLGDESKAIKDVLREDAVVRQGEMQKFIVAEMDKAKKEGKQLNMLEFNEAVRKIGATVDETLLALTDQVRRIETPPDFRQELMRHMAMYSAMLKDQTQQIMGNTQLALEDTTTQIRSLSSTVSHVSDQMILAKRSVEAAGGETQEVVNRNLMEMQRMLGAFAQGQQEQLTIMNRARDQYFDMFRQQLREFDLVKTTLAAIENQRMETEKRQLALMDESKQQSTALLQLMDIVRNQSMEAQKAQLQEQAALTDREPILALEDAPHQADTGSVGGFLSKFIPKKQGLLDAAMSTPAPLTPFNPYAFNPFLPQDQQVNSGVAQMSRMGGEPSGSGWTRP